jgi:DNA-binding MarR family transcriptional regulator
MMDKMSNASRLVDKLKAKGFVNRVECPEDRRQVNIGLTAAGIKLLEETTVVVNESMKFMENLSEEEAKVLSDLLDRIRQ